MIANDGSRPRKQGADGKWMDYRIDVSVDGRLKKFEVGMDKLLNPEHRRGWVKRTSSTSTLIPDVAQGARQLLAAVARQIILDQLSTWLQENQVPQGQIELAVQEVGASLDHTLGDAVNDSGASALFALAALHLRARDHGDRIFDLMFDDVKASLQSKLQNRHLPLNQLKLSLRRTFLEQLDRFEQDLREAAMLRVPPGFPVNLYANLTPGKMAQAFLAHARYRGDPRGFANALLQMSACPDLVEDSGHTYGHNLPAEDKRALIEFLKTF
jgi:hypothetical protein